MSHDEPMAPEQALMILQQAAELAALPKVGHIEVERAVQVLAHMIRDVGNSTAEAS